MKNTVLIMLIALAVVTAGSVGWWLFGRYESIKAGVVDRTKDDVTSFVRSKIFTYVRPEDFSSKDASHQSEVFKNFFVTIQSVDFVRIKVWDKNFTVIWSDLSELIGKRFPGNHELEEALEGEVELEIEKNKAENVYERQFPDLLEVYVPIFSAGGEVIGVIEVYKSAVPLYAEVGTKFQKLFIPAMAFTLLGYLGAAFILWFVFKPRRTAAV